MAGTLAEYDEKHREQGSRDHGDGCDRGAHTVAHHLFFTALDVEKARMCVRVKKRNDEHEIIHRAERFDLLAEDQKDHKKYRDGQVRECLNA